MTDLVRQASPATHAALREAMSGLEEARAAAGFGVSAAPPPLLVAEQAPTVTDLVRTGSEALRDALSETMTELAAAKKAAGFGPSSSAAPAPSSMTSLVRTASPVSTRNLLLLRESCC